MVPHHADHCDAAVGAYVLEELPVSAAAPTSCLASDRTVLALPLGHYCLRPRARSGSTDPVFLLRSHDDQYVNFLGLVPVELT